MSSADNNTQNETTTTKVDTPTSPLAGDELKAAIKSQVEFYFSPQNLPSDTYLLSNMDEEQYVPVSLIATFGKMVALTSDQNLVAECLEDSKFVELSSDKTKLRPKEGKRRNRIILHNLPPETTDQEVKDLFAKGNFSPEINPDVNNCWFISFDSPEEATSGLEFIKKQKIHDKNIRARLKPEAQLRTIFSQPPPFIPQTPYVYTPGMPFTPSPGWNPMYFDPNAENFNQNDGKEGYRRNYKKGNRKDANRKGYEGNKKRPGNRKNKGRDKKPAAPLGPSDFPPLPTNDNKHTGYSKAFIKYSETDLVGALKKLDVQKPSDLDEQFPVTAQACTDLEVENVVPIEFSDLPVRTAPLPLSERVKTSPAAQQPKTTETPKKDTGKQNQKQKQKQKQNQSQKQNQNQKQKAKAVPQPRTAETKQEDAKGSTWSQIAKAGNQKAKSQPKPTNTAAPGNANGSPKQA